MSKELIKNINLYYTIAVPDPVGHSLDMSEFPVLGTRSRPDTSSNLSSAMGIPGLLTSRHGYGTGRLSYYCNHIPHSMINAIETARCVTVQYTCNQQFKTILVNFHAIFSYICLLGLK